MVTSTSLHHTAAVKYGMGWRISLRFVGFRVAAVDRAASAHPLWCQHVVLHSWVQSPSTARQAYYESHALYDRPVATLDDAATLADDDVDLGRPQASPSVPPTRALYDRPAADALADHAGDLEAPSMSTHCATGPTPVCDCVVTSIKYHAVAWTASDNGGAGAKP